MLSKIDECIKQNNPDNCSDFVVEPIENADALLLQAQAEIISKANDQASKIEALEDEQQLIEHLRDKEGYTEEQVTKLIQERGGFEEVRTSVAEAIIDRAYNTVAAMKKHKEVASMSAVEQLQEKRKELDNDIKRKTDKIRFDALSQAGLNVTTTGSDGEAQSKGNVEVAQRELEDSASFYGDDANAGAQESLAQRNVATSKKDDEGEDRVSSGATVSASQINDLILPALDKKNPNSGLQDPDDPNAQTANQAP